MRCLFTAAVALALLAAPAHLADYSTPCATPPGTPYNAPTLRERAKPCCDSAFTSLTHVGILVAASAKTNNVSLPMTANCSDSSPNHVNVNFNDGSLVLHINTSNAPGIDLVHVSLRGPRFTVRAWSSSVYSPGQNKSPRTLQLSSNTARNDVAAMTRVTVVFQCRDPIPVEHFPSRRNMTEVTVKGPCVTYVAVLVSMDDSCQPPFKDPPMPSLRDRAGDGDSKHDMYARHTELTSIYCAVP